LQPFAEAPEQLRISEWGAKWGVVLLVEDKDFRFAAFIL
jgi:hypothetical protein